MAERRLAPEDALSGGLHAPGYYYRPNVVATGPSSAVDLLYLVPFLIARRCTIDRLAIAFSSPQPGSATMTVRPGLYSDVDGLPSALLASGAIPGDQPGWTWAETVVSVPVLPGRYWLGWAQNGTGTAAALSVGAFRAETVLVRHTGVPQSGVLRVDGVTGALPATITTIGWQDESMTVMAVRRAA